MNCLNPIRIKNPQYPEFSELKYIDCACRKCFPCLVNQRRHWYFRLFNQSMNSHCSYFVSFDYAPKYNVTNVNKRDLQLFFKRLRKKGLLFSYYAIGEFGTDEECSHHPHYHCLMFFRSLVTKDCLELMCKEAWQYGRVVVGYVEPASINYVLHYHVRPKRPFGENDPRKTFAVMSKGLGLSFLDEHVGTLLQMLTSTTNRKVTNVYGESFVLPRYYVRKLIDYGLKVCDPDYSSIDWSVSNLRTLVEKLDKSIKFENDGNVRPDFDERYNSLVRDILLESHRMLSKYNKQDKIF